MTNTEDDQITDTDTGTESVLISGEAHKTYATAMRKWSGWPKSRLTFAEPDSGSAFGVTNKVDQTFTINADALVLNPNRVLLTVTPFRMRQEAVLTGVMLHEAGHARFSNWLPRTEEEAPNFLHSDGTPLHEKTVAFARLVEEARIEGRMNHVASDIGATGLPWTMRAAAAHLLPMTNLSDDPNQMVMDVISSWVLRAGRVIAVGEHLPAWVGQFDNLLWDVLKEHCEKQGPIKAYTATKIVDLLKAMVRWDGITRDPAPGDPRAALFADEDKPKPAPHTGPFMLDTAREILRMLFPETDEDSLPTMQGGCAACAAPQQGGEQPGGGSGQSDPADAGEDQEDNAAGEGDGSEVSDRISSLLAGVEAAADEQGRAAMCDEQAKPPPVQSLTPMSGGSMGGFGQGAPTSRGWRTPDKDEREIQKGAEKFLRDLVNPSETSVTGLSDSPAATVDPAALSAWKAGGMERDPRFFRRLRRNVQPNPPVKVAVLADISGSMNILQKPTALLSWALSSAALDLRNFAGRGAQVQSCLIHWGDSVHVIQPNGGVLPGIKEFPCNEGTTAMGAALEEVERQMPGFFDPSDEPEHRLLVQFTDWMLSSRGESEAMHMVQRALNSGVNMLSVMPNSGKPRDLRVAEERAQGSTGKSFTMQYDRKRPAQVWDTAAALMK